MEQQDAVLSGLSIDNLPAPPVYLDNPSLVKAISDEDREVLHLISTKARDRMGDIVDSKGANIKNFKRNPVVLANHHYSIESILGRSVFIDATDEGLWTRTKFRETPLADTAFQLTKERLGGWSIGFSPTKRHSIKQGKDLECPTCTELWEQLADGKEAGDWVEGSFGAHFTAWELLEYSSVAIPANQDIVNNAVQRGLCPEALVGQFFKTQQAIPTSEVAADGPTVEPATETYQMSEGVRRRLRTSLDDHYAGLRVQDTAARVGKILRSREP